MAPVSRHRWLVPVAVPALLAALAAGLVGLAALSRPGTAAPAVTVAWTFEPAERGAIISSPVVEGDRVYVAAVRDQGLASSGVVYALDRATGKVLWQFDNGGEMQQTYSTPCLASGRLYVGEGMHGNHVCNLYCLDAATGRELWHFQTEDHIESSPCAANGKVFFGAGDDGVYCLDAVTGARVWQFRAPVHVDTSPEASGRFLYVGSGVSRTRKSPAVYCLDAATGEAVWRRATDLPAWGSPAVDGDRLYVGLGNGRLLQSAEPPERPAGALLCLDAATGQPLWDYPVADGVFVRPAVSAGRVYFGARDGACYCVDRDGRPCWRTDLGSPVVTRADLAGDRVYVVASRGPAACLDAGSGRVLWTFDIAAATRTTPQLLSSPAVVAGDDGGRAGRRIYFGAELKNPVSSAAVLYCLQD
jgi:eukaryotic-like serine/threonine-protein kinase